MFIFRFESLSYKIQICRTLLRHSASVSALIPALALGVTSAQAASVDAFTPDMVEDISGGRPVLHVEDNYGIFEALAHGDEARLQFIQTELAHLIQKEPTFSHKVMLGFCLSAIARLHGDYETSDLLLNTMTSKLGPIADPERTVNPLDFMIEQTRSGNLLLRGHIRGWALLQEKIERQYFKPLRAYYHMPNLEFSNAQPMTLTVPAASIPDQAVRLPFFDTVSFSTMPSTFTQQGVRAAATQVILDGETTPALIGTATLTGLLPEKFVRAHKLRVIGNTNAVSDGSGKISSQEFVLMPSLVLGKTVFLNQLFAVSQGTEIVIGLQQLSQLRHVTITRQGMTYGLHAPFQCTADLITASLRAGYASQWLLPIQQGSHSEMAMVDTGDNNEAVLNVRTSHIPASGEISSDFQETPEGRQSSQTATVPAVLSVGAVSITDQIRFTLTATDSVPSALTYGLLKYGSLQFDWPEHKACFN